MDKGSSAEELRVVLLGKTGAGKSSLGNTLLGRDEFRVARGMSSGTEKCQWADELIGGTVLKVTDTPGLCDTHRDENDVLREVGKSVLVVSPGPHVIVMVFRCDRRFTEEEYQAYVVLKALFGETICQHMIVVFAGADAFGDTQEEQEDGLRENLEQSSQTLQTILHDASGRVFPVNNKGSREARQKQASILLTAMQALVRQNGGLYFTSELIEGMDRLKEPLIQKRMQNNMSREEATIETNRAVVQEEEDPRFFTQMMDFIRNKIFPVLKHLYPVAKDVAVAVVTSLVMKKAGEKCFLM